MNDIEGIFNRLNKWAPFPNYQLERRADIFFAYYLPTILSRCFNIDESIITLDRIIPEFPLLKKDTKPGKKSNLSTKVDYAVFTDEDEKKNKHMYFIELKTTNNSIDYKQIDNLIKARNEFTTIIDEFFYLCEGIKSDGKPMRKTRAQKKPAKPALADDSSAKIKALEEEILSMEQSKVDLEKRFELGENPPAQSDYEEYAVIDARLAELYAEWETLIG